MNLLSRLRAAFGGKSVGEGAARGPFFGLGELGSLFEIGPLDEGWQRNLVAPSMGREVSIVYSCVMLYARTIMQCTPRHLKIDGETGAATQTTTSPAAHLFRVPNQYETWAQLVMNTTCDLLFDGQAGWVAQRDGRGAVSAVHRIHRRGWSAAVDPETGAVFYPVGDLSGGLVPSELKFAVPARDFAHFRMHTPRHPLIGESPIVAAALAVGINVALSRSQVAFFSQMRRPSGFLSTEATLNATQMAQLRAAFDAQSKGMNQGNMPILGGGLKFQPMTINSVDSQLIESQKMSALDVARVFGVPMALLSEGSGPQGGTEAIINHWLSTGLGALIESIERTLDRLFDFGPSDRIELDTAPLLRTDFSARIEGLTKAITGGLLSPNEARAREGLPPVKFGAEPRLQAQVVPLSQVDMLTSAPAAPAAPVEVEEDDPEADDPEADDPEARRLDPVTAGDITRATIAKVLQA